MLEQAVDIAGNRAVLFHNARRDPICNTLSLDKILVERPNLHTAGIGLPAWITWRGEDRVLDRKDKATPWDQKSSYPRTYGSKVFYITFGASLK